VPSLSPPTGFDAPATISLMNFDAFGAFGRFSNFRKGTLATNTAIGIGISSKAVAAPMAPKKPKERGQSISTWPTLLVIPAS
jgi:hypothetical protein